MAASFMIALISSPFLSCTKSSFSKSSNISRGSTVVAHFSHGFNHQHSLSNRYTLDNRNFNYHNKLEMARSMLSEMKDSLSAMETINLFQHLGIDYHFSEEINTIICSLYDYFSISNVRLCKDWRNSLHVVALSFRLLRQEGHYVSPGLVAREKIEHCLENPIHKSLQRYNTRRYIDRYEGDFGMNRMLKELATFDFNMVQLQHKNDYIKVLRWWKQLDLSKQPKFYRDQLMKWFMWSMTILPDPKFSKQRIEITKVIVLIYLIDDIFDVIGSPQELVLFTDIVKSWDNSQNDSLPTYMKSFYNTLYNTTNEIADWITKEHGWNPIDSLRKSWVSLLEAFLVENRWFTYKFTPNVNEYLENGVITTGVHVLLSHLNFLLGNRGSKQILALLNDDNTQLFTQTAMILRLWDDLSSNKEDENQDGFDG